MLLKQVRTGARVSNDEILGFAKLFNDELTLDNISRLVLLPLLCSTSCILLLRILHFGIALSLLTHLLVVKMENRPRLVNMCKYMGISPYGTDAYLRYMLRKRLQE